ERSGQICNKLDGIFTFAVIYDDEFLVARDPIGIKPLYYGKDNDGRYLFSSEMKTIEDICGERCLKTFPPGHFWTPKSGFIQYYNPLWYEPLNATHEESLLEIRQILTEATIKRLISDAPLGVLLSGGLDSSIVSSIAAREMQRIGRQLMSFSIALDGDQPDAIAARKVAEFIGTDHHEFHFTIQEGIENLKNLIWHLESYDVTSIRASTPMFFLSKKISNLGVKVVLSGEGADEIFGGYLYFHNAPNDYEFQKETIRRVNLLSTADCLRADKSCMANAVEVRVPFLDKKFLDVAMMTHPRYKRPIMYNGQPIEKYILRKAFDTQEEPYLPKEILWRQKEQFSDGVGYCWIDSLRQHCINNVSDAEMMSAEQLFPYNTPTTKEGFYYRKIFHELFPSENAAKTVKKWIPKWQKNEDPSGRVCSVHIQKLATEQSN
uniref:Asparagine synthetase [glutamine-hydrolyzing] n=1 Tax=Syphacia muris TaxID=451379 RepID=A0A0N5ATE7_9BILA